MAITTRSRLLLATVVAALVGGGGRARAQGADDPEEMRKEIRNLKGQIQSLKSALSEAAEYDRMLAAALQRAMGGGSSATSTAEPAPPPPPAARERAPEPPRRARPAPSLAPQPSRAQAEPGGTLRGRVEIRSSEPVAYVYVENIRGPAVHNEVKKIEQLNKQFVPAWAVVQRGTTVQFPNLDNIYHNVFSLSSGNTFDLGLYNSSGDAKGHTFDEPGAVDVYCNIHPQMAASVLVVPNRFFARVKSDGTFEIAGVPSGRRKVVAWAPGSKLSADWVEVPAGATAEVTLKLEPKSGGHSNKLGRPYGSYE